MGSRTDFGCQAGPGDWVLGSISDLVLATQRLGLPMGWCLFPVPHGVVFAHNVVDFRELDAYSDKTVIVVDIDNTPLESVADCGRVDEALGGVATFTEIRFSPRPDRSLSRLSVPTTSTPNPTSTPSNSLSARPRPDPQDPKDEDSNEQSSNTDRYLPPPPTDPRTIVYKTQKRFASAYDVIDLLKSIERYEVFPS